MEQNTINLKQLAVDITEGKVFGSWEIIEQDFSATLPLVFFPLAFGALEKLTEEPVVFYEYYKNQYPVATPGKYPQFPTVKYLTEAQLGKVLEHMSAYQTMKQSFLEQQ